MKKIIVFAFIFLFFLIGCNQENFDQIKNDLIDFIPDTVDSSITLPKEVRGCKVDYSSNNQNYFSNTGVVSPGFTDQEITITITISKGRSSEVFTIRTIVLAIEKEVNVDIISEIEVGATILINNFNTSLYNVTVEDDTIIALTSDNKLSGIKVGETNVVVSLKEYPNISETFNIIVLSTSDYFNLIFSKIETYVKYETDRNISNNIFYPAKVLEYDATLTFKPRDESLLTSDGVITRQAEDTIAYVDVTVHYKGLEKVFLKTYLVLKVEKVEQLRLTEQWLNENIKDVLKNKCGQLPVKEERFQRKVEWVSDIPGAIDSNNCILKSYIEEDVKLIAAINISGERVEFMYSYKTDDSLTFEEYLNRYLKDLIPEFATNRINILYNSVVDIIEDFIYPDSVQQIRPGTGKNGQKMPGGPQYVVIHDTGMTRIIDTAKGLNEYIHRQAAGIVLDNSESLRGASWHFSIDDHEAYQHIPTDEIAWHAGDGSRAFGTKWQNGIYYCIGGGNRNGIGIETCINPGNDYTMTIARTAKLTAQLLHQYGLGMDRIKKHYDFSGKNCPNVINGTTQMWEWFLESCEFQLFLLRCGKNIEFSWDIDKPNIIGYNGLVTRATTDQEVNITLNFKYDGIAREYKYKVLVEKRTF